MILVSPTSTLTDRHRLEKNLMDSAVIEKEAMKLPLQERAVLVDRLAQTLIADPTSLTIWSDIADQRLSQFHDGKMDALDNSDIIQALRK